jgi:hypothetical protein
MTTGSHRTPYDDGYESCLETRAELLIYTGAIPPDEVSSRLGTEPTEINVAGRVRVNEYGRERVVKTSSWSLSSEGHVQSKDVRSHLDWLLARLEPSRTALLQLQSEADVRMSINVVWWSRGGSGGPTLWPQQMRAMSDLNLECSFDVYFESDDDE